MTIKIFLNYKKRNRGQSLIEVIVALGIVVVLATALITSGLITQRSSRAAKNSAQAARLAEENAEQIRVFRDRKGFSALPGGTCFVLDATSSDPLNWSFGSSGCPQGELVVLDNTNFRRKISITADGATRKDIVVTVSWQETGGTQTVTNETILSEWCFGTIQPGLPCQ